MELYILRHGIAEDASATVADRDRRLTPEGIERTRASAKAMKKLGLELDAILASPFPRAWETARIVAEELNSDQKLKECEALASGAGIAGIIAELRKTAPQHRSMMVVGHEPELSQLISALVSGSHKLSIAMKKGALCKLDCLSPEPGGARLEWLVTAKHLCRMV